MEFLGGELYLGKKRVIQPMCSMINAPEQKNKSSLTCCCFANLEKKNNLAKQEKYNNLPFLFFCSGAFDHGTHSLDFFLFP